MHNHFLYTIIAILCVMGCVGNPDPPEDADDDLNAGGLNLTTSVRGENTFGTQAKNLTRQESRLFVAGNALFRSNWVEAPASVTSLDGLGPLFNAASCGSCHFKDGRAAPPDEFPVHKSGLLFRISNGTQDIHGSPVPHGIYGSQIQDRAIPSVKPEADIEITYTEITGRYPDGTTYSLQKPSYVVQNPQYGPVGTYELSPRIATHLSGMGLLESIAEADILANEDINDLDGDGISGKANYVYDHEHQELRLGRFGWKANQPSLRHQNASAFQADMGLTSSIHPYDDWTDAQAAIQPDTTYGGYPEVSDEQLFRITLYVQALSVPASRNTETAQFQSGKKLFHKIKCQSCHHPRYTTQTGNDLQVLDSQKIAPYTDLLLHDMGEGLADNRSDFKANGREWRTAPLWGLGLIPAVNKHSRYLHDGRARNIEEAMLWHGGEAEQSKNDFKKLTKQEREDLLFFVKSL